VAWKEEQQQSASICQTKNEKLEHDWINGQENIQDETCSSAN